jgi:hypothetical protein
MLSGNILRLAQTTLWPSSTEVKYVGRSAIAWGSAAAHNLAAFSQSELGFATDFNITAPAKRTLGHTRGQIYCAMA